MADTVPTPTQAEHARQIFERTRTPLEAFLAENARQAANPFIDPEARARDIEARFRRLLGVTWPGVVHDLDSIELTGPEGVLDAVRRQEAQLGEHNARLSAILSHLGGK
jgi:hypothetical protein